MNNSNVSPFNHYVTILLKIAAALGDLKPNCLGIRKWMSLIKNKNIGIKNIILQ